ncbi:MAG TPA: uracil-DNA glycosylase family protein [Casimicrobiaceae bacterium]
MTSIEREVLDAARTLARAVTGLDFPPPVAHVYNPLDYAFASYEQYVHRFGASRKKVVLVGMNPGPFGMVQTGVPFGEVAAVRDWMGIHAAVGSPASAHPKRPVDGFACTRSEVSGRRLWGWAAARAGSAEAFFVDWFVLNYCPLAFVEASGRNLTPDHLPATAQRDLYAACDLHLARALAALAPSWAIGIGDFAAKRIRSLLESDGVDPRLARSLKSGRILHPSPANPTANRGWAEAVDGELAALGVPLPGSSISAATRSPSRAQRSQAPARRRRAS